MRGLARVVDRFCEFAHTSSGFFRGAIAGVLLAIVAFELCIGFKLGGHGFSIAVDDIGSGTAPVLAAVACWVAACRTRRSTRLGWTLLGASAASWAGGEAVWSYIEVGL